MKCLNYQPFELSLSSLAYLTFCVMLTEVEAARRGRVSVAWLRCAAGPGVPLALRMIAPTTLGQVWKVECGGRLSPVDRRRRHRILALALVQLGGNYKLGHFATARRQRSVRVVGADQLAQPVKLSL